MLEGVVSHKTAHLKVIIVEDGKPTRQKVLFLTLNGIDGSLASPGRAPILRTKSVTKKKINKCMAEIYGYK